MKTKSQSNAERPLYEAPAATTIELFPEGTLCTSNQNAYSEDFGEETYYSIF